MSFVSDSKPVIDKELLARLPRTFLPVLNDHLRQWDLLFPAERRPLRATLEYLTRLPAADFDELLAPIKRVESQMDLSGWDARTERLSIEATSVLARSPRYPEWRAEVEKLFDRISAATGESEFAKSHKFVLSVLPAGLPLESEPLWPRLAKHGRWFQLDRPFASAAEKLVTALAARKPLPGSEPVEHTWILESEAEFVNSCDCANLTVLSYAALTPARNQFRWRMNEIEKDLRSADETFDGLRHLKIEFLLGGRLEKDPRLREFVRNLFLSGNGAVLFCNSFVQWGAHEALRRAQPQALACFFGIRHKLKPFSSLVLFEDQNRANPVRDQPDPAGSLVDIQFLCDYIYLSAESLDSHRGRTLHWLAAAEADLILLIAPPGFPELPAGPVAKVDLDELIRITISWLETA
jgi:hypothetical protein